MKEKWTEAEVMALPTGEHNYFDRKSGKLLGNMHNFQEHFAAALSALANSGGGHIIFGQEDDGTLTGADPTKGRTPMREWLEQKLPYLVSYPLEAFRVHQVIRETGGSTIPLDKEVFVIDVGDSRLAPHQTYFPQDKPQYYYRQGGKSVLAPHHYLEALRNRLAYAVLEARLDKVHVGRAWRDGENYAVLEIVLTFTAKNVSRVACYKWGLDVALRGDVDMNERIRTQAQFTMLGSGRGIPVDTTILPTREGEWVAFIGLRVNRMESLEKQVQENWPKLNVVYYPISENHISAETKTKLDSIPPHHPLLAQMQGSLEREGIAFTP
jgi:hypothetical protein